MPPPARVRYGSLPFGEQIAFFRRKVPLPTEGWQDIWRDAHDTAFVVAGANRQAIVEDFREAVRKAVEEGTTLQEFRKDFDRIVARHGWTYRGKRGWRTRVIYATNLRASYSAGRYAQLTEPEFLKRHPYWRYIHSDAVVTPREQHLAWHGLLLKASDPWWKTHWPPNGWGCQCRVRALSEAALRRLRENGRIDKAPSDGTRAWRDARGRTHRVPNGIDPGWDYAPGAGVARETRKALLDRGTSPAALREPVRRPRDAATAMASAEPRLLERFAGGRAAPALKAQRRRVQTPETRLALGPGSDRRGVQLLREAAGLLPPDWVDYMNGLGALRVRMIARGGFSVTVTARRPQTWARREPFLDVATLRDGEGIIAIPDDRAAVMHELAHRLQKTLPGLAAIFEEYHKKRWNNGKGGRIEKRGGKVFQAPERDYPTLYFGRIYKDDRPLDLMASAFEYVLGGDDRKLQQIVRQEPELLRLVLGALTYRADELL